MATLTIRNLGTNVVQALKLLAKANNRSLEGEVRALMERHAQTPSAHKLIALANDIAALTPKDRPQTDSALLLAENRSR